MTVNRSFWESDRTPDYSPPATKNLSVQVDVVEAGTRNLFAGKLDGCSDSTVASASSS